MRAPWRSKNREYVDGPNSVVEETIDAIKLPHPPSRPPSRSLTFRRRVFGSGECDKTTQETQRRHYRNGSQVRSRSRSSGRVHERRRSRYRGTGDEGRSRGTDCANLSAQRGSLLVDLLDVPLRGRTKAPSQSPPPPFRSPLGYVHADAGGKQSDVRRTTNLETLDEHSRPIAFTGIRRSSSRCKDRQRLGDGVSGIEHGRRMPSDDYDWYDRDGMRVRVREV